MTEKIQITKYAAEALNVKKHELEKKLARFEKKQGDILDVQVTQSELKSVQDLLDQSEIIEFTEKQPPVVVIGTKIMLENLRTNDTREYTIMTRNTANPLKGIISNESPLAQKILGLKLGNTFKFRDVTAHEETYKIKSID